MRQYDKALEEYYRVLRIFHDLIVSHLPPPEEEPSQDNADGASDVQTGPES
jgi:hypothetical protein